MTEPLHLRFPLHEVTLLGLPDIAARALRAVWGACVNIETGTRDRSIWEIRASPEGYELSGSSSVPDRVHDASLVAPLVEACLYASFMAWHPQDAFLHAATIVRGDRPVVLVGRSGSGKSSIALEAARAGWSYVTDELTMTDGDTVSGISRTIQFHPAPLGTKLPERLADLDTESYRTFDENGNLRTQPLYPWDRLHVEENDLRAEAALVIVLDGPAADTVLAPASPMETLAFVLGERRGERGTLGSLVGAGRTHRLRWSDPREALSAIAAVCDALQG